MLETLRYSCVFLKIFSFLIRISKHHVRYHYFGIHFGKIVETGEAESLMDNPKHEYTKQLLNSVPKISVH